MYVTMSEARPEMLPDGARYSVLIEGAGWRACRMFGAEYGVSGRETYRVQTLDGKVWSHCHPDCVRAWVTT